MKCQPPSSINCILFSLNIFQKGFFAFLDFRCLNQEKDLRFFFRYSFDVEIQALSIYDVSRSIPALLPSIQTDLVTKGVSKLKHFDEIRWTGYMGSDSREAHKIDPHTRYGASTNFLHEYSLFKNSMRLLKTKK